MSGSALSADAIGKAPLQITKQVTMRRRISLLSRDLSDRRKFRTRRAFDLAFPVGTGRGSGKGKRRGCDSNEKKYRFSSRRGMAAIAGGGNVHCAIEKWPESFFRWLTL